MQDDTVTSGIVKNSRFRYITMSSRQLTTGCWLLAGFRIFCWLLFTGYCLL
jgi:hypothetical protein